jgi:hypothetical protein
MLDARQWPTVGGASTPHSVFRPQRFRENIQKVFSGSLLTEIERTRTAGDELLRTIESTRKVFELPELPKFEIPSAVFRAAEPTSEAQFDAASLARAQRQAFESPFKSLGEKLDALVEVALDTAQSSLQGNKTQTQIAAALQKTADENKHATGTTLD